MSKSKSSAYELNLRKFLARGVSLNALYKRYLRCIKCREIFLGKVLN